MEDTAPAPREPAPPAESAAPAATRRDLNIASVCALLLLIGMPIGYLSGDTSTGDVIGLIVLTLVSLALMVWLINWLVPHERAVSPGRATRTATILGLLAALTVIVFWTGLPFALGAAAIALGLWLRDAGPTGSRGRATAAVACGVLAVAASFVVLLTG